jgi:thiol-disulfide isomerase/thioredoxin
MLKLLLFSLISHGGSLPSKSLYEEDTDFIQILTQVRNLLKTKSYQNLKETFKETLERPEEKNQFWIVEFYASWCGHCVHFAPTIKEFAGEIKEWTNLVKLGVIDCGNKENGDICRENQVQGKFKLL